jgi:hypothetical protein
MMEEESLRVTLPHEVADQELLKDLFSQEHGTHADAAEPLSLPHCS